MFVDRIADDGARPAPPGFTVAIQNVAVCGTDKATIYIATDIDPNGDQIAVSLLSMTEVAEAVSSLTDGEKTALAKIAKVYARRTPYDHRDLLQEAICRVLEGRRSWPAGSSATLFIGGVMRSIAWEWQDDCFDEETDIGDEGAEARGVMSRLDLTKIMGLFRDDPVAQRIIAGIIEGARGEELQITCGVTQTEYESKRRKIRRRLEKLLL
ncbi:MAG: hypothetical protein C5B56_05975 [Proteobacteria bacterium]|nr:MAG: hypothetical protein C5B56_05975 [Pseudomonadota bacterium]